MEVNDYVRTKSGGIGKIIEIDNNCSCSHIITDNETFGLGWDLEQVNWDFITEIVKSSPNIIDLIEVGDYVNGEKVISLFNPTFLSIGELPYVITDKSKYEPQEIKSIVTKEQFESMEYKVKE